MARDFFARDSDSGRFPLGNLCWVHEVAPVHRCIQQWNLTDPAWALERSQPAEKPLANRTNPRHISSLKKKEGPQAAYRSPGSSCLSVVVNFSFGTDATDMAVGISSFPAHLMIRRIGHCTPALSAVQLAILPHIHSRQIIRAKQPMDHCVSVLQQRLWDDCPDFRPPAVAHLSFPGHQPQRLDPRTPVSYTHLTLPTKA